MAALHRVLFVLPLFLFTANSQFPLSNPFLGGSDENGSNVGLDIPGFAISSPLTPQPSDNVNINRGNSGDTPPYETNYKGFWELVSLDSGVSAMHVNLLPDNKLIIIDASAFHISKIKLPNGECIPYKDDDGKIPREDCWSHSVEYDINTARIRPLKIQWDPWCSSGGLTVDGNLISTGGWLNGSRTVRYITGCETCDWREYEVAFADARWYATQATLADGRFIVVGGRKSYSYEYVPAVGNVNTQSIKFPFLFQTSDLDENNLYPFVHLSTDGNVFIFANNRSVLLNPNTNIIIKEFPVLPGGSRNYPASGMSALLPIKLYVQNAPVITAEVVVCGGATPDAYGLAGRGTFTPALQDCNRLAITNPAAVWRTETMPSRRVMGDMLILPNGELLMINGATLGTAAWGYADGPNFTPVIYSPDKPKIQRFKELNPSAIPRMYHSSSALLPDGKVLIGGSNTNPGYNFTAKYPTEMRIEKFSPPYLDPALAVHRPQILVASSETILAYGKNFMVQFSLGSPTVDKTDIKVTMYAPPFTTHGFSMNQRLLVLGKVDVSSALPNVHQVEAVAPPSAAVAPPGYYLLFVNYRGVPSVGLWVQIK